jgi:hypothetical protein
MLAHARVVAFIAATSLAAVASGCGGNGNGATGDGGDDSPAIATTTSSSGGPQTAGGPPSPSSAGQQPERELPALPGETRPRETVTTADGTVLMLPARPRQLVAAPSPSCTAEAPGGRRFLPPRPGVRATRVGARRLEVEVSFKDIPARCRPYGVRITADVNGDPLPPSTHRFPFEDVERPLVIDLPERVANADVVYASTWLRSGASSDSAAVLVAPHR